MRDLLTELNTTLHNKRPCVYCVIVERRGSAPQKAGAVGLVHADGSQCGTLGGGCVEPEVRERALRVLGGEDDRAEVLGFQVDDDYGWVDDLVGGGRVCGPAGALC